MNSALDLIKQHGLGGLAILTVVFAALFVGPRLNEIDRKQFDMINTLDARTKAVNEVIKQRVHAAELEYQREFTELRSELVKLHARLVLLEKRPVASPEMLRARQEIMKRLDRLEDHLLFPRHHSE